MCTVLLLREVHPDFPLVVAANRDEFYARAATPPQLLVERPRAIGGRDSERAGTWMGATEHGFFVGLTNQRLKGATVPAARSRGEVVLRALELGTIEGVERLLGGLDPRDFLPFNLLYGDAHRLRVAYVRPLEPLVTEDVPPGVHVLPNDRLDSPLFPKVERAKELVAPWLQRPWPELVRGLEAVLGDHHKPPLGPAAEDLPFPPEFLRELGALCIHTPGYGTRSSAILALEPGRVAHYLATAEAHGAWSDMTPLLHGAPVAVRAR